MSSYDIKVNPVLPWDDEKLVAAVFLFVFNIGLTASLLYDILKKIGNILEEIKNGGPISLFLGLSRKMAFFGAKCF